jgi:hypothetical protein
VCRDGEVLVDRLRVERRRGQPETEVVAFDVGETASVACVTVTTKEGSAHGDHAQGGNGGCGGRDHDADCEGGGHGDDFEHNSASIAVVLDGAEPPLIGPERFDGKETIVEQPTEALSAGAHELAVTVAGKPGTYAEITVRAGGSADRPDLAVSQRGSFELFSAWAEPAPWSPAVGPLGLSALGTLLRLPGCGHDGDPEDCDDDGGGDRDDDHGDHRFWHGRREGQGRGLPSDHGGSHSPDGRHSKCDDGDGDHGDDDDHDDHDNDGLPGANCEHGRAPYELAWTFELRRVATCAVVHELSGALPLERPGPFSVSTVWDGLVDGATVQDGELSYRLVAQLECSSRRRHHVVDEAAMAQKKLLADASPPILVVLTPADGAALPSPFVDVEITWRDPLASDGSASGLDPSSAAIFLDGQDVTGLCATDITGARCELDLSSLPDGSHALEATISDLAGNTGEASSAWMVDTAPPQTAPRQPTRPACRFWVTALLFSPRCSVPSSSSPTFDRWVCTTRWGMTATS